MWSTFWITLERRIHLIFMVANFLLMAYQTEFKLKVVKSFLAGDGGAKLLARQWSVPEEKIRT